MNNQILDHDEGNEIPLFRTQTISPILILTPISMLYAMANMILLDGNTGNEEPFLILIMLTFLLLIVDRLVIWKLKQHRKIILWSEWVIILLIFIKFVYE